MAVDSIHSIRSVQDLDGWYGSVREKFDAIARPWPACWGFQVNHGESGRYLTEEQVSSVLPSPYAMNLYYSMCNANERGDLSADEVFAHLEDSEWLDMTAGEYMSEGGFSAETVFPEDEFSHFELVDLALERPDLFEADDIKSFHGLAAAAWEAGTLTRDALVEDPGLVGALLQEVPDAFGGERVYVSSEEGFAGPHTEPELRAYFESEPDLDQQRADGTTFDTWMDEMVHMGILEEGRASIGAHTHDEPLIGYSAAWNAVRISPVKTRYGDVSEYRFDDTGLIDGDGVTYAPFLETRDAAFFCSEDASLGQGVVMLNIFRDAGEVTLASDNEFAANELTMLIDREVAYQLEAADRIRDGVAYGTPFKEPGIDPVWTSAEFRSTVDAEAADIAGTDRSPIKAAVEAATLQRSHGEQRDAREGDAR